MHRLPSIAIVLGITWSIAALAACSSNKTDPGTSENGGDDDASADPGSSGNDNGDPSSGSNGGSGSGSASHPSSGSSNTTSSGSGSHGGSSASDAGSSACTQNNCDPHTCTVCVPQNGGLDAAVCMSGTDIKCGGNAATFHCASSDDCDTGEVCCGSFDLNASTLTTACAKGKCPAAFPLCTTGTQCQLCKHDDECGGGTCTDQVCNGNEVHFCAQNALCTAN